MCFHRTNCEAVHVHDLMKNTIFINYRTIVKHLFGVLRDINHQMNGKYIYISIASLKHCSQLLTYIHSSCIWGLRTAVKHRTLFHVSAITLTACK